MNRQSFLPRTDATRHASHGREQLQSCPPKRIWDAVTVFAVVMMFVFLLATTTRGEGTPLLTTDDPGTPGPGRWEINAAWVHTGGGGERAMQLPLLELNYGLGDQCQLKYATAWLIHRDQADVESSGLDHSTIGLKWRFRSEPQHGFDLSVHPQFKFREPGPSARHGLVADENALVLPVQWQHTRGPWVFFAELGRNLPSKSADGWFYGVAVCRNLGPVVTLGAEFNGTASNSLDEDQLAVNIGAHIEVGSLGALLITVGRDVRRRPGEASASTILLGWQVQL